MEPTPARGGKSVHLRFKDRSDVHVEALILAEGGSLLLRPLTDYLPTCLVPIGGTPILDHQIQTLRSVGVNNITVLGGYRAAQVEQSCRAYDVVRFRLNPRYSREEPFLSAIRTAGPLAGSPLLLVRGDVLFAPSLVEGLLRGPQENRVVTGANGAPVGIWRLSPRAADALFAASGAAPTGGDSEPFLQAGLEAILDGLGFETVPAEDTSWARVATMEDLARALTVHRRMGEIRVAQSREKLRRLPTGAGPASPDGPVSSANADPGPGSFWSRATPSSPGSGRGSPVKPVRP